MTEYEEYRIEIHKGDSGSGWWCQKRIQLPVEGVGWDEDDLHYMLEHNLFEKMVGVVMALFGPESDWEDAYGDEEE